MVLTMPLPFVILLDAHVHRWRMKLALARCVLIAPDIMLLDEPTNHLDAGTVAWFVDLLQKEKHATVLVVSHDTGFLDNVCTVQDETEKKKLFFFFAPLRILLSHNYFLCVFDTGCSVRVCVDGYVTYAK